MNTTPASNPLGTNRYGVDVDYFRRELAKLAESLPTRPGAELAQYLRVLANVAEPNSSDAMTRMDELILAESRFFESNLYFKGKNMSQGFVPVEAARASVVDIVKKMLAHLAAPHLSGNPGQLAQAPLSDHAIGDEEGTADRHMQWAADGDDLEKSFNQLHAYAKTLEARIAKAQPIEKLEQLAQAPGLDANWVVRRCDEAFYAPIPRTPEKTAAIQLKIIEMIRSQAMATITETEKLAAQPPESNRGGEADMHEAGRVIIDLCTALESVADVEGVAPESVKTAWNNGCRWMAGGLLPSESKGGGDAREAAHALIRNVIQERFDISISSAGEDASDILDKLKEYGYEVRAQPEIPTAKPTPAERIANAINIISIHQDDDARTVGPESTIRMLREILEGEYGEEGAKPGAGDTAEADDAPPWPIDREDYHDALRYLIKDLAERNAAIDRIMATPGSTDGGKA